MEIKGPTVDVPLDASGGDLQSIIDPLQNRLQLLFLCDLRLGHLCDIQLLTFKLLYRMETQGQIRVEKMEKVSRSSGRAFLDI